MCVMPFLYIRLHGMFDSIELCLHIAISSGFCCLYLPSPFNIYSKIYGFILKFVNILCV